MNKMPPVLYESSLDLPLNLFTAVEVASGSVAGAAAVETSAAGVTADTSVAAAGAPLNSAFDADFEPPPPILLPILPYRNEVRQIKKTQWSFSHVVFGRVDEMWS